MKRISGYVIPVLELVLVAALIACAISGCGHRTESAVAKPAPRQHHIPAPIQPVSDDIDKQLSRATGFGIAATWLSVAGLIFVIFEASAFLRIALAIAASSAGATIVLFALRLSVPILALAIPWAMGAMALAAIVAAWLWWRHQDPVCLKNPLRCLLKPPAAPPFTDPE